MQAAVLVTELLLFICLECHGLQLQVNTNVNSSDYCAILSCHENIVTPPAVDRKTTNDLDTAKAASGVHRLSRLEVYRITGESPGILVAGVTEKHNKLTKHFDGKEVGNGFLNSNEAQLTLSLRGQDCQASFRCQALSVDAEGQTHLNKLIAKIDRPPHAITKERTKTRSAKPKVVRAAPNDNLEDFHSGRDGQDKPQTQSWTSQALIHIISLIEQLQIKLAVLEEKTQTKEEMVSPTDGLREQISTLTDRLASIDGRIAELDDKVDAIDGKVFAMNGKFSLSGREEDISAAYDELKEKVTSGMDKRLSAIRDEMTQFRESFIATVHLTLESTIERCDDNTSYLVAREVMAGLGENIVERVQQSLGLIDRNLSDIADFSPTLKIAEGSVDGIMERVDAWMANASSRFLEGLPKCMPSPKEDPSNECEDLVMARRNYSSSCDKIPGLISTFQHLESTYGNLTVPSSCEKDGLIPPLRSYFKYLVLFSNHREKYAQFPILCDTHTNNGGWTVIQRRVSGDVDFYRGWSEYKSGFGSFSGDFWLGLDKIHDLISDGIYQLRIDLKYKDKTYFAQYTLFYITGESTNYTLYISGYQGNAKDSLGYHDGMQFSTYDRDNDMDSSKNCAEVRTGAWWHNSCDESNLNGQWNEQSNKGVIWDGVSTTNSVTFSEMKIRKMG